MNTISFQSWHEQRNGELSRTGKPCTWRDDLTLLAAVWAKWGDRIANVNSVMQNATCAARHGARACWAGKQSLRRTASGREPSVSPQKIGSVRSRGWLQELPRLLCGPADRPGRCPLVPATTSEAELRTAVAIAILFLLRVVHPWDFGLFRCLHPHIWAMGMEYGAHALF